MKLDTNKIKGLRYFVFGVAAMLAIIITLFGGGIFTSFGVLFVIGFLLGWNGQKFKRLYEDYRLGLRVNAIMFSSGQMEKQQKERDQLVEEVRQLRERIAAYNILKEGDQA